MKSSNRLHLRVMRAGAITALVAMTGVVPLAQSAGAATISYSGSGYDASYPQGNSTPPLGMTFAIIGVTHGRPFTTNPYASNQFGSVTAGPNSLYFNTGYALAYAKSDTTTCTSGSLKYNPAGASGHTLSALRAAWAIGCSEASYAVSNEPGIPAMWWADVETGNSWSNDTALNQATIMGIVDEMTGHGNLIGIYSTPSMWASITGSNFVVPGVSGDWQAGLKTCTASTTGFTLINDSTSPYAQVLVAQYGTVTSNGTTYDSDQGC